MSRPVNSTQRFRARYLAAGLPKTGLTVTAKVWKPDGTVLASSPTVSEMSDGLYQTSAVTLDAAGEWTCQFTAPAGQGLDDRFLAASVAVDDWDAALQSFQRINEINDALVASGRVDKLDLLIPASTSNGVGAGIVAQVSSFLPEGGESGDESPPNNYYRFDLGLTPERVAALDALLSGLVVAGFDPAATDALETAVGDAFDGAGIPIAGLATAGALDAVAAAVAALGSRPILSPSALTDAGSVRVLVGMDYLAGEGAPTYDLAARDLSGAEAIGLFDADGGLALPGTLAGSILTVPIPASWTAARAPRGGVLRLNLGAQYSDRRVDLWSSVELVVSRTR